MKRETYRRFAYIETCLYWGRGITAGQLGKTFQIARQNAQNTIEAYRQLHPDNMIYDASEKKHIATDNFSRNYISLEPRHYLDYLRGNWLANRYWEDEEWEGVEIHDVDATFRPHLDTNCVCKVVSAIQSQQTLKLYYHAKAGGFEDLTVAPNHLAYASKRYHLRAYCFEYSKFIDLVLSRIIEAEISHEDWVSSEEDHQWNTYTKLHFIPNPTLPEQTQQTLLLDYRLSNDTYIVSTRMALKGYVLREMERLDWKYKIPLWLPVQE
jgi:hypothetical protein